MLPPAGGNTVGWLRLAAEYQLVPGEAEQAQFFVRGLAGLDVAEEGHAGGPGDVPVGLDGIEALEVVAEFGGEFDLRPVGAWGLVGGSHMAVDVFTRQDPRHQPPS